MDEAGRNLGTVLEQMATRFELVVEAVTSFGGRLEALREELNGQFAEVGKQIRFLSDQIGENRQSLKELRSDLSAEVVRLGEAVGATRVEFRQQLGETRDTLKLEVSQQAEKTRSEQSRLRRAAAASAPAAGLDSDHLKEAVVAATEAATRRLETDLKQANKMLAGLNRKLEHLDDRATIQSKDHEQRLKKLERRRSSG